MNGRDCDNCGHHLEDDDYEGYGSWSYICPECGFVYRHSSKLTPDEQVNKFNGEEDD